MQFNHVNTIDGARVITPLNTMLRNTYMLLSLTLMFSAATAYFAVISNAGFMGSLVSSVVAFGFLFVISKTRNTAFAIAAAFIFTGLMGYAMGPMLNHYIRGYSNGGQLIMTALGGTGLTFLLSSGYILVTKKDLSNMGKFLMVGLVVCIVASLGNLFFKMPAIQLAVSSMMVFISTMLMMYDTSRIVNGGQTNYVMATVSLYLDILNLFQNLLYLLAAFSGNNRN